MDGKGRHHSWPAVAPGDVVWLGSDIKLPLTWKAWFALASISL